MLWGGGGKQCYMDRFYPDLKTQFKSNFGAISYITMNSYARPWSQVHMIDLPDECEWVFTLALAYAYMTAHDLMQSKENRNEHHDPRIITAVAYMIICACVT